MIKLYWLGVLINLGLIIAAYKDEEFAIIMDNNFPLDNKQKLLLLLSCFLSWIIPVYLIFRKNDN